MKTKRIVALALAGALALGAVTPAFAEEAKKATKEELTLNTAQAFNKVVVAQKKVVDDLEKKLEDLKKDQETKLTKQNDARAAVLAKKADIKAQEKKIEDIQKDIEKKQDERKSLVDEASDLLIELGEIKKSYDFEFKSSDAEYKALYEARWKEFKNEQAKEGITDNAQLQEKWNKDAKRLVIKQAQNKFKKYQGKLDDAKTKSHEIQNRVKDKKFEEAILEKKQEELKTLEAAEKAANSAYAAVTKDVEVTNQKLLDELVVQKRIAEVGKYLTQQNIKEVVDPKIAEMANKDNVFFILWYLEAHQNLRISQEALKELNLDGATLKAYEDVLADEGSVAPAESSQEEESKKPDESKPNEEKPGTSEETPAPVVPGNKDNTATDNKDNKDNKKDNKKATKKSKKAPKTGDIAVLAYAGTAVLAAGAYVASKKRK